MEVAKGRPHARSLNFICNKYDILYIKFNFYGLFSADKLLLAYCTGGGSVYKAKSIGDSGHPCPMPQACKILLI